MLDKAIEEIKYALRRVKEVENELADIRTKLIEAEAELSNKKKDLYRQDKIDGSNKEKRELQVKHYANKEYTKINLLKTKLVRMQAEYNNCLREWETWRLIVRSYDYKL